MAEAAEQREHDVAVIAGVCRWWQAGADLRRISRWSAVLLGAMLPVVFVTGDLRAALTFAAATALGVAAIGRAETGLDRRRVAQLALIGAGFRALALLLGGVLQAAGDTLVLGPDGATFLGAAVTMLESRAVLPESSFAMLGSFDVGHVYVFAALIGLFGRSVLMLQMFNCAVTALIAPLTFAWVRRVAPTVALPAALLVAVYPSIVYLAAIDIWKDPLVITATTAGIWAIARIVHDRLRGVSLGMAVATGTVCLAFVHTCRFYPVWYLEVGMAMTGALALLHRARIDVRATVAVVAIVALVELVPAAAGWPTSPRAFAAGIVQATSASSMRHYTAGLLDRLAGGAAPPAERGSAYRVKALEGFGLGAFGRRNALQVDIETASSTPGRFGLLGWGVQMVRRIWGPFLWVPPDTLSARAVLGGDYLLYPGMVFWYALLPFMGAGLVLVGLDLLRGRAPFALGMVWVYAVAYSGQFLVINLPYRQREAMFPLLVVFGLLAVTALWRHGWIRRAYVMYWVGLAVVAVAHTLVRASQRLAG